MVSLRAAVRTCATVCVTAVPVLFAKAGWRMGSQTDSQSDESNPELPASQSAMELWWQALGSHLALAL
jgi:hypothetical protein